MYRLPFISLMLLLLTLSQAQSPHGEHLTMNCGVCHNSTGWNIPLDSTQFDHSSTSFVLEGSHASTDCKSCHSSLIFESAQTDCISCHKDLHNMTVGNDCIRCHNSDSWLVNNIPELHEQNGFPLTGAHNFISCNDCHLSETNLRFDRLGNECINCHLRDYQLTSRPDHQKSGYSTDCTSCHSPIALSWAGDINHNFFPLTKGHDISDCRQCHLTDNFADASPECISCHRDDFMATRSPDHQKLNFSMDCMLCHTTDLDWQPANFTSHDEYYFPIFSGKHQNEWNECRDCHSDPDNYASFTCTTCHKNPETDREHREVAGYSFKSQACLACHPTGDEDSRFDHNRTQFPLTGAHIGAECISCHSEGFAGTTTACISCHTTDFKTAKNPDHIGLKISEDCTNCHSTDPDWNPASFISHDDYYPLTGAHAAIASDCVLCHNGDYNSTPNTCAGCHSGDYNATTNPNHIEVQFNQDCATCHSSTSWTPATFDHDNQFFPIYSGAHNGEWADCVECHTNPGNFKIVNCTDCHKAPQTDQEHTSIQGYVYESMACLVCHPNGESTGAFDHSFTNFPLTGSHMGLDCRECHSDGYQGTSSECIDCHKADFNNARNPNHIGLNLPADCASCHTTEAGWTPASFEIHDNFYPLKGSHASIASECASCHTGGNFQNTPNTCAECHITDFNATRNPDHKAAHISTDCIDCHNEGSWTPSSFDHDNYYAISGAHKIIANDCAACHKNGNYTTTPNTCVGCHKTDFDNTQNPNHKTAQFPTDCESCHSQSSWQPATFNHDLFFPIVGAHKTISNDCRACHTNGSYNSTPNTCVGCHISEYNSTRDPNHKSAQFPTECIECHTQSAWEPANFNHDQKYFPIYSGKHRGEWNSCTECHTNSSNYSLFSCIICHEHSNKSKVDREHKEVRNYSYESTACFSCHPRGKGD